MTFAILCIKHAPKKPPYSLILHSPQNVFREVCDIHVSSPLSSHLVVQLKTKTFDHTTHKLMMSIKDINNGYLMEQQGSDGRVG